MSSKFRLPMEKQIADREMHPRTPRIFFPPSNAMRGGPACPDAVMPPRSHSKAPTTATQPHPDPGQQRKATGGEVRESPMPLNYTGSFVRGRSDTAGRFLSRAEWRLALDPCITVTPGGRLFLCCLSLCSILPFSLSAFSCFSFAFH